MLGHLRMQSTTSRAPHVVVIGGSYAGLAAIQNMIRMIQARELLPSPIPQKAPEVLPTIKPKITLIDRRDGFFHTMGAPQALAVRGYAERAWKGYADCSSLKRAGVEFIQGQVASVDILHRVVKYQTLAGSPTEKSVNTEIHYDYLVAASGLNRPWPIVPFHHTKHAYLEDIEGQRTDLEQVKGAIVIVGGGAVGIETAAEIAQAYPRKRVILVHSRSDLLSSEPLPVDYKQQVWQLLCQANVEVQLERRVVGHVVVLENTKEQFDRLFLSTGEVLDAGKVIFCTAKPSPNTQFLPMDCLNELGFVKIKADLSLAVDIPNADFHLAIGDIAAWDGMKSVGAALFMGQCAAINVIGRMGIDTRSSVASNFVPAMLPSFPLIMNLAIGGNAATLGPDGLVTSGEGIHETFFGNDLGLKT
ncbi:hypothetical protein ABOM_005027 [Aspergillus bombycis]|uniref:FAD/NAD(P)-binding domain-containing protein n=1 Tax=Aspergillus bombycis TaxID=109264 RepID=A0A1F8A526_9EURO|nr:hypothetical protein ABOM_005027 [Aspergillus bombycis]OGM46804.1 hypothetical protein ABOM_005027 [Aspergillus bombycis]